jgi:uncharacterized membrane protein
MNPNKNARSESAAQGEIGPQSEIMRKNVAAIIQMQQKEAQARSLQHRVAAALTDFSGSMAFVYLHAIWFGLWMILNLGLIKIPHLTQFDPYPFGLLTLTVSLEAIFLSTFVLIAQNNLSKISERRAELDLQVNLLAEQKAAKVLELLDKIAKELNSIHSHFNYTSDAETEALKLSPEPHHVLSVIEQGVNGAAAQQKIEKPNNEGDSMPDDVTAGNEKPDEVTSYVEQLKAVLKSNKP